MRHIHAVIGVCIRGGAAFYVKRSAKMLNYPDVWSLPSIQTDAAFAETPESAFDRMATERFEGVKVSVVRGLISGSSDKNPIDADVSLRLFEIKFSGLPILNPEYYTDAAWLTADEYERISEDQPCGLCVRLWADYAWLAGYSHRPFREASA